ncbi:MAG: 16S rRNA processing protein RimM [Bryobacteraceae bacterium]|nr:16S rRNA processing protein RimM [Bryobacteraceae bacterium]
MVSEFPSRDPSEEEWVTIARLTRTRGNKGELAAISLSNQPGRFEELGEVRLAGGRGLPPTPHGFQVERVWEHDGRPIFKFRGVDSISEAERLEGAAVQIPASQRVSLPEGEYYVSDLEGCAVFERGRSEPLGTVTGWLEAGGALSLEVTMKDTGRKFLAPFANAICVEIDVTGRRIVVDLPQGLKDIDA